MIIKAFRESFRWFFEPSQEPGVWAAIEWWELRRIRVNLMIGAYGIPCFIVFFWAILTSGVLQEGEDAVEPIALLFAPIGFNICYTLGWIVEGTARLIQPAVSPRLRPFLMKLGLGFSFWVITFPALYWGGYRCLQLLHVLH
jgi:hypothetical protein